MVCDLLVSDHLFVKVLLATNISSKYISRAMQSDYDSVIQDSFQSTAARPTSSKQSPLPGDTNGVFKWEEDDYCNEGPTDSQFNMVHEMVSSL